LILSQNQRKDKHRATYSRQHEELAAALRRAREKSGLTQRQLAAKLRLTQSQVAKIELGSQAVRVVELIGWAEATDSDAVEILKAIV
jgi:transcriptional regulator with XRE-family HTH domain